MAQLTPLPYECPLKVLNGMAFHLRKNINDMNLVSDCLNRLEDDVLKVLTNHDTRWVLEKHEDAHSELDLWLERESREVILDRTFIDGSSGTRWIIDYKSSRPSPQESEEQFLEREVETYREQLFAYAEAILQRDIALGTPRPVKTALLFPTLGRLHEVKFASCFESSV